MFATGELPVRLMSSTHGWICVNDALPTSDGVFMPGPPNPGSKMCSAGRSSVAAFNFGMIRDPM